MSDMDNIRIFCGSEHSKDLEHLKNSFSRVNIRLHDAPHALINYGAQKWKESTGGFLIIPEPFEAKPFAHFASTAVEKEKRQGKILDVLLTNFWLNSLFVDIQVGDRSMFQNIGGELQQKHLMIYDSHNVLKDNPEHPLALLIKTFQLMYEAGTVRQNIDDMFKIIESEDELIEHSITAGKIYGSNTNKHNAVESDEVWQRVKATLETDLQLAAEGFNYHQVLEELRTGLRIGGSVFTSTKTFTGDNSTAQCELLAQGFVQRGIAGVTGMGSVGHMGIFHRALKKAGGMSVGWITPDVLDIECPPPDADYIGISPTINEREWQILSHGQFSVIGAGGRGGAGTAKEFSSYLLTQYNNSRATNYIDRNGEKQPKPVFIDDRLGIMSPLAKIAQVLSLNEKEHIRKCSSSEEVLTGIDSYLAARRSYRSQITHSRESAMFV